MREIAANALFKSDEVMRVVSEHEAGSREIHTLEKNNVVLNCAFVSLKSKL